MKRIEAWKKVIAYTILVIFLVLSQIPMYFLFITAFKEKDEIYRSDITWFPRNVTFSNFTRVFSWEGRTDFVYYIRNSAGIALISTLVVIVLGSLAGYAFSKFRFWGSVILLFMILFSRVIPPISLLVPFYKMASNLRLADTWTAIIWTNVYVSLPFMIWLLKGFFDTVPSELPESARVDGCTNYGAFLRVVLPMAAPGIGAAAILTYLFSWNEFIFAQVLSNTNAARTIPVGLFDFVGDYYVDYGAMTAAAVVASVPAIVFIIFFQKYIVSGLLAGAMKG
jgi:multiple sugar transport system permease protein